MNKSVIIGIIAAICIALIAGAFLLTSNVDIYQDCSGNVSAKSSDLTFYYNNDLSIYGYYIDNVFQNTAYYNDAKIKGKVKFDLSKVNWSDTYVPTSNQTYYGDYYYAEDDGSDSAQLNVNNVTYAEEFAAENITSDFPDNVNVSVKMYFYDKDGGDVDLTYLSSEYDEMNVTSIEDGIVTLKVNYKFTSDSTEIDNDSPYQGELSNTQSNFDKTHEALVVMDFYNDNYHYCIYSSLTGDDFTISHM